MLLGVQKQDFQTKKKKNNNNNNNSMETNKKKSKKGFKQERGVRPRSNTRFTQSFQWSFSLWWLSDFEERDFSCWCPSQAAVHLFVWVCVRNVTILIPTVQWAQDSITTSVFMIFQKQVSTKEVFFCLFVLEREKKKTSRQKTDRDKAIKIDCACSVHRMVQLSLPKKKKKQQYKYIFLIFAVMLVWPAWLTTFHQHHISRYFFFPCHRNVNSFVVFFVCFFLRKCISVTCNQNSSS